MTFDVMSRKCDQCLLTPERIVSAARMRQIIRDCRRRDVSFICHKSPAGREIACRGHLDTGVGQMSRIAERLGMVREIDPVTLEPVAGGASASITGDAVSVSGANEGIAPESPSDQRTPAA